VEIPEAPAIFSIDMALKKRISTIRAYRSSNAAKASNAEFKSRNWTF
jgi:hypothetical protein